MIIISNGFNKFHLSVAAMEAERRGLLSCFITGVYPKASGRRLLELGVPSSMPRLARLTARTEVIDDQLIRSLWWGEALYNVAALVRHTVPRLSEELKMISFVMYGKGATPHVIKAAKAGAKLYHYRAGFGHASVRAARNIGMTVLCDYSLVHAGLLATLIEDSGRMPQEGAATPMSPMWRQILKDAQQADVVVLNSDFVRETFVHQGWNADRLRVIYWGVDDAFVDALPPRGGDDNGSGPLRLLFAGGFERRKGAETVMAALKRCNDIPWTLEIAGTVDPDVSQHREFLQDSRVTVTGWLPRVELAKRMSLAEVFVFPSLAEGSARVVFEALAAGCYVITTPNAGSIVNDRIHGRLIATGDPCPLIAAIREAAANRPRLAEVGRYNARLVRSEYRQRHYGDKLTALYKDLLESKRAE